MSVVIVAPRNRQETVMPAVRLAVSAALLVALSSLPAAAEPRRYTLDPDHLVVAFKSRHLGLPDVLGRFLKASGSFVYAGEARSVEALGRPPSRGEGGKHGEIPGGIGTMKIKTTRK